MSNQQQLQQQESVQRTLWLAVRQGLLLVCAAIEKAYGLKKGNG